MNIFVGCSSTDTNNEKFNRSAEKMGDFIAQGDHDFVFCGCQSGLIGMVCSKVVKSPKSKIFVAAAKAHESCLKPLPNSKTYIFKTVNQAKDAFFSLANVLVFLPGGIGTADEILAAIETKRAREHDLPIVILNEGGFFNPLLDFLKQIYDEGLAESSACQLYFVAQAFDEVAKRLSNISK